MKYMGSKSRIAKYIVPIIQQKMEKSSITTYIEPFCGGCNVIDKVQCENKIASDNHKCLISMFQNLEKIETLPEFVTKEHYSDVRNQFNNKPHEKEYPDWYVGAIGFLASYNGRFFDGGYAGIRHTKSGVDRNYYDEAKRNLLEQIPKLEDTTFQCGDYEELYSDVENCLLYCDIPYKGVKQYGTSKNFNYNRFWNWAEKMSVNNIVLVSEHVAPENWDCIWKQEIQRTINNAKHTKAIEKLFCYQGEINETI